MNDEPLPVFALDYHQSDEQTPWLAVVRLLSILCIISNGITAISSSYFAWYYLDLDHRAMYIRIGYSSGWLLCTSIVLLLSALTSAGLVVGAWNCIRRRERWRQFIVRLCWVKVILIAVSTVMAIGFYASRIPQIDMLQTMMQLVGRELSGSLLLTIATAIIFARPQVKRAFAVPELPIRR